MTDANFEDSLKYMRRLELSTGKIVLSTIATLPDGYNLYKYFSTINNLNETADIYGCVYLPTDNVLGMLEVLMK